MVRRIEKNEGGLKLDGIFFQIKPVEDVTTSPEYTIHVFKFTDTAKAVESDGCEFEIQPHCSTTPMTTTSKDYSCDRIAVGEKGYFLGLSPEGDVVCYEIGSHLGDKNPLIPLELGWTDCFIAGDKVNNVVDVSTPPFDPKNETEVKVNAAVDALGKPIPEKFWHYYHTLRSGNKAEVAQLEITYPNETIK
ncbi:hypothetical protein HYV64_01370 [Candidatus Shapirobacteria bacterium]|nr:hypothetical protein [Candidatus Shapirobacteria bacterium]